METNLLRADRVSVPLHNRFTKEMVSAMIRMLAVVLCGLVLTGCAGIIRDSTQMLSITSAPPAATVVLSDGQVCTTPCELKVARAQDIQVELSLEGYETQMANLESRVDAVGIGAQGVNLLGILQVVSAVSYYVFISEIVGASGLATSAYIVGGAGIAAIIYAANRDRVQGKLRSIYPNPLHIELQARRSTTQPDPSPPPKHSRN